MKVKRTWRKSLKKVSIKKSLMGTNSTGIVVKPNLVILVSLYLPELNLFKSYMIYRFPNMTGKAEY